MRLVVVLARTMVALGVPVGLPAVGAMYITATTVASAAPTPGGVGAIEAALAAGLTGLGTCAGQTCRHRAHLPPLQLLDPDTAGLAGVHSFAAARRR